MTRIVMKLILVRHGETVDNIKGIIQGHTPGKLTERGEEQARKVALRLKDEKIDVIFSSDLKRAKDTAEEIAKFHKVPLICTPGLRERSYGIWEGKSIEEFREVRKKSGVPKVEYAPEGGESYVQTGERVRKFINGLIGKYSGKTVLLVSHGGPIKAIISLLLDRPIEEEVEMKVSNASISIFKVQKNAKFKAHLINSVSHL